MERWNHRLAFAFLPDREAGLKPSMNDKHRCLRMAEECERMARRTVSAEDRATLSQMAKLWRELADSTVTAEWVEEVSHRPTPTSRKHS